jgi:nucleoside-diphosphate-sugar epimerase
MILVTGATGFLGRPLVEELAKKGHKVRVLCRDVEAGRKLFPKAEIFRADLSDPASLKGAANGADTVIHLAGLVSYSKSRDKLFAANVDTTRNLLEECRGVKRIVFASSVGVYAKIRGVADECYHLGPRNAYGESKLESELLVKKSGIPCVILRIAPVYGKGSPSWKKALKFLSSGFPIPKTKNLTHVVHVSDVVQAIEKSLKKGDGVYNIADKEPMPFMGFAEAIVKQMGRKPRRMPMLIERGIVKAMRMGTYFDVLTENRNYSIRKAEKELGYAPEADFNKELKGMIEWYRGLQ